EEAVADRRDDRRQEQGADVDADQDPQDGAKAATVGKHGQVGAIALATARLEFLGIDSCWRWRHFRFRRPPGSSSRGRYNPTGTREVHWSSESHRGPMSMRRPRPRCGPGRPMDLATVLVFHSPVSEIMTDQLAKKSAAWSGRFSEPV